MDASVLVGWILKEPRVDVAAVEAAFQGVVLMSAVNWAETLSAIRVRRGIAPVRTWSQMAASGTLYRDIILEPFTPEGAIATAELHIKIEPFLPKNKHGDPIPVGIADATCLALGKTLALPVLTIDPAWRHFDDVGVNVRFLTR